MSRYGSLININPSGLAQDPDRVAQRESKSKFALILNEIISPFKQAFQKRQKKNGGR